MTDKITIDRKEFIYILENDLLQSTAFVSFIDTLELCMQKKDDHFTKETMQIGDNIRRAVLDISVHKTLLLESIRNDEQ